MSSFKPSLAKRFLRQKHAAACLLVSLAAGVVLAPPARAGVALAPFKDKLFAYGKVLDSNADGSFLVVDYNEMRDVNGRDTVPVLRVQRQYVDLSARSEERRVDVQHDGHTIAVDETGRSKNARFAVVFIHGRGGDRRLGSNDWTFGGNFNRIKNLAVRNGGLYVAPSVPSFDEKGATDVAALIGEIASNSPQAQIVLACASMGSFVCWRLAKDAPTVRRLSGMMILGGASDRDYIRSAAFRARLPLFFSHGSRDPVYPWRRQKEFFDSIRGANPGYPTRFVLFEGGIHGTPVRMTDWRTELNSIFGIGR